MEGRSARKKIDSSKWGSTFPDEMKTEDNSMSFTKRMMYICFSQLLHLRELLPDSAFKARKFEGIRLRVFETRNPLGRRNAQRLLNAASAIEKGYLKEIYLVVSENSEDDGDAVEVYKMAINYGETPSLRLTDKAGRMLTDIRFVSMEDTKEQTRRLIIRLLQICGTLKPLPKNAEASYRLVYNDHTPSVYELDGFRRCPDLYHFSQNPETVTVGSVIAKYHKCVMSVESVYIDDADELEEQLRAANTTDDRLSYAGHGDMTLGNSFEKMNQEDAGATEDNRSMEQCVEEVEEKRERRSLSHQSLKDMEEEETEVEKARKMGDGDEALDESSLSTDSSKERRQNLQKAIDDKAESLAQRESVEIPSKRTKKSKTKPAKTDSSKTNAAVYADRSPMYRKSGNVSKVTPHASP